MISYLLYYTALTIVVLAFFTSLLSFKFDYPYHLKVFSVILGFTFLNETGSWFITAVLGKKNVSWYNIFMGIEFCLYAWYFRLIIVGKTLRRFITALSILFIVFWFYAVFRIFRLSVWNSYVAIAGSTFVICLCILYGYQLFTNKMLVWLKNHAEFWICVGLFIFYSCNLPFLGMLNFLNTKYPDMARNLLNVLQSLHILMYSLFIYAFICLIPSKK